MMYHLQMSVALISVANLGMEVDAWRSVFPTGDEWQQIDIAFDEFVPVFRGRMVPQAGPVVPSEIQQIGFLLADKEAGRFELEIRHIEFIGAEDTLNND